MTGFTDVSGVDMRSTLARSNHTIMTTDTAADNLRMIHGTGCNRNPGSRSRLVTGITHIGGIDMIKTFTTGN